MTDQNADRLENEANDIRKGIAETAGAIQDRMSPGKMVDEFFNYMKNSDGKLAIDNLGKQARDNPMALAMIGSGVAWLIFGGGADATTKNGHAPSYGSMRNGRSPSPNRSTSQNGGEPANQDEGMVSSTVSAVSDGISATADKARDMFGDAKDAVVQTADEAREFAGAASERGHAAAGSMRDMAERGRQSAMDAMYREPLVIGAIGLAVGAAIGAMLPGTRIEDETFGETRDALRRDAGEAVDQAAEKAREVGGEALHAAKAAVKETREQV